MPDPTAGVDKIIRDAQAEGKFEDLEGKGKPLVLDMSPDAVVNNLLREANVKPAWIEMETQIERLLSEAESVVTQFAGVSPPTAGSAGHGTASPEHRSPSRWYTHLFSHARRIPRTEPRAPERSDLLEYNRRWESRLACYADLLHRANRIIPQFNLIVPMVQRQRPRIRVQERLEAFADRFPCYERDSAGTPCPVRGVVPEALLSPPPAREGDSAGGRDLQRAAALQEVRRFGRRPPPIG
jgi:hypothetical protein